MTNRQFAKRRFSRSFVPWSIVRWWYPSAAARSAVYSGEWDLQKKLSGRAL